MWLQSPNPIISDMYSIIQRTISPFSAQVAEIKLITIITARVMLDEDRNQRNQFIFAHKP